MKRELLDILCCPECKGELRLEEALHSGAEVESGWLVCLCGKRFPIRNFIPRFVTSDQYADSFSLEWTIHARTQLDRNGSTRSRDTFFEKTGFSPESFPGKWVLDVGVGSGRFADVASNCGANVVGIDLSFAVDAARGNFTNRSNIHLIQADVFRLPFRLGSFDFIYSIGVLHHTPNCREAFAQLPPFLVPGGSIAIWVYAKDLYEYQSGNGIPMAKWKRSLFSFKHRSSLLTSGLYRQFTTRMNLRVLYRLCHLAIPYWYFTQLPLIGHLFRILWPISPERRAEWRVLDTFDWYSPRYQSKHSFNEVRHWFEEAGLSEVRPLFHAPVAVQGRKPEGRPAGDGPR
jgi:SAM-dependent methyltransferase